MTRTGPKRPILMRSVNLIWYPLTLIPILALLYFSFTGVLHSFVAMLAVFAFFFWLSSLGFAIWTKLRKPRELRQ
jgi:hypothetical protein